MAKTAEIIALLEEFAPISTSQPWDNVGWQINFANPEVNKVILCLTVTESVVKQAISENCDFILSHHPVFFDPIKKIADKYVLDAIKKGIQIYSVHTNIDVAMGGTSDMLAAKLGFFELQFINEFIRYKNFDHEINVNDFVYRMKNDLNINNLRVVNKENVETFKSIAFCAGSGGSFIPEIKKFNIDLYVTGDVKYHDALVADKLVVVDIGHFDSEKFVTEIFRNILQKTNVEIIIANEEDIWKTV